MNRKIVIAAVVASLAVSMSTRLAQAATMVDFTITATAEDPSATFQLPLNPTPDVSVSGQYFIINNVPIGGSAPPVLDLQFLNANYFGGGVCDYSFSCSYINFFQDTPTQLYSGPESNPTFLPGTYVGFDSDSEPQTLTISETPLPSTQTMLAAGFVGFGFILFVKSKKSAGGGRVSEAVERS